MHKKELKEKKKAPENKIHLVFTDSYEPITDTRKKGV
jgi:hypothetical protein